MLLKKTHFLQRRKQKPGQIIFLPLAHITYKWTYLQIQICGLNSECHWRLINEWNCRLELEYCFLSTLPQNQLNSSFNLFKFPFSVLNSVSYLYSDLWNSVLFRCAAVLRHRSSSNSLQISDQNTPCTKPFQQYWQHLISTLHC